MHAKINENIKENNQLTIADNTGTAKINENSMESSQP